MLVYNNPFVPDFVEGFYSPIRDNMTVDVLLIASFLLIVLDVIFGSINAAMHHEFDSSIFRQGMVHKCGDFGFIIVGIIIDAMILAGINLPFDIPDGCAVSLVCVGIVLMELASLMEIWTKMDPSLKENPLFKLLRSAHVLPEEGGDETEDGE